MTAVFILVGIVEVVIAAIVAVTVPVRRVDAVVSEFSWNSILLIGPPCELAVWGPGRVLAFWLFA
jgi:hypothetical protein